MNIKMPEFNVKKLMKDCTSQLNRVVQLTEEKLGTCGERTELDTNFENLVERSEMTKNWTEKILKDSEAVLTPNPGNRVEDFIFEKIEKKKPQRLSNLEYFGLDLIEAGSDFGQDGPYGSALIKAGQAENKLGQCERDFIGSAGICFVQPLKKFLEGEMKTITKEKGILEGKRLDLDACKNRVRKARSMIGTQPKDGISPEMALDQAERDLRVAQSEFDRQAEITKLLLEGVGATQAQHLRYLHAFVESQVRYFSQCNKIMADLQKELASLGGYEIVCDEEDVSGAGANTSGQLKYRRARVLCSYDARDGTELSLQANEVIMVVECSPTHADYMQGMQGLLKGLVPRAFLELLDD